MSVINKITDYFKKHEEEAQTKTNQIWVKKIQIEPLIFDPVDPGKIITLKKDAKIQLEIERYADINKTKKKHHKAVLNIVLKKGFQTNGASTVEAGLEDFIPASISGQEDEYDKHIFNAAPFIHDGLYGLKGEIKVENESSNPNNKTRYTLTRSECDDILYEIWRKSKYVGAGKALLAKIAVNVAAGGTEHWHVDENSKKYFLATIAYKG